ncbi:hypothetical protein BS78_02G009200 [Paspalum vaginatum]|nr:hypothetical protein BS78_02G009200 [Paspalum vaginatum]
MEMERVINFLLHEDPPADCDFGVLPIVGPGKVGKTTLVEHVRCDETVRSHFSRVIFLSDNDFKEENQQAKIWEGSRIKNQHGGSSSKERFLVVIELVGDIDEGAWRRLHSSASQSRIPRGSKVIITNPEEQPRFASIAMEIFDEYFDQDVLKAFAWPFIYLNKAAVSLKSSFNVQSWNRILAYFKDNRRQNEPGFREGLISGCCSRVNSDDVLLQRVANPAQYCVVRNHGRVAPVDEEAPKLTSHDILNGAGSVILPRSKFDI